MIWGYHYFWKHPCVFCGCWHFLDEGSAIWPFVGFVAGFFHCLWILKKKQFCYLLENRDWVGLWFKREANSLSSIRWGEKLPRYLHDLIRENRDAGYFTWKTTCCFLLFMIIHSGNGCFFSGMDGSFVRKKILKSDVKFSTEHPPRTRHADTLGIC